MRYVGRLSDWNDDKGFGFVVPHGGGDRAFVHVKAFQHGSRRPVEGDLISYAVAQDARGRIKAADIRFAGQRIDTRTPPRPWPRAALGGVVLLLIGACGWAGVLPGPLAIAYFVLSGISYACYGMDKAAAGRGAQRTPETTLHLLDLLGGWPGALIAQQSFRHKTVKASFQRGFWFTVVVNLLAVGWSLKSGFAASLLQ